MAGARHGMCELTARHGRGTAWVRQAMCESALTHTFRHLINISTALTTQEERNKY